MIVAIYKQSRNKPWKHQIKDILLHPENYFSDETEDSNSDDIQSQDNSSEQNNQTVDTSLSSEPTGLLKTVHNDLVYCLGCNHLHPTSYECIKPKNSTRNLPPLKRSSSLHTQRDSKSIKKKDKNSKTTIDRSVKYSLSNETQIDQSGNTTDNLILQRIPPISTTKVTTQQPTTKIMIVRVPKVAGELVIQPKEH